MEVSRDKKFVGIGVVIFLFVVLSNFLDGKHTPPDGHKSRSQAPVVYVDKETGCEYLMLGDTALVPRLEASGQPRCSGRPAPRPVTAPLPAHAPPGAQLSPAEVAAALAKIQQGAPAAAPSQATPPQAASRAPQ